MDGLSRALILRHLKLGTFVNLFGIFFSHLQKQAPEVFYEKSCS